MGRFCAYLRWPTREEAAQDRSTTIRRGSGKTMSRCRRDAVAAAISLRIRRFAGRLAKPFAGENRPHSFPCESYPDTLSERCTEERRQRAVVHPCWPGSRASRTFGPF
ncbi:MAG: hypothetical protein H0Z34_15370 [Brevibacillus sp.]|nr:hypothetical protein [Brevibacillus sp.]